MTIYQHWQLGHFNVADNKGVLKGNTMIYCEIYRAFTLTKNGKVTYAEAIELTAEAMNTSTRTVKRAISFVKK